MNLKDMGVQGKLAARRLGLADAAARDGWLRGVAQALEERGAGVLEANQADLQEARANGLSEAMLDRLMLNPTRLAGMAGDLRSLADMPDPLAETFDASRLPSGLQVYKQRVPIGVLGVIYEARPNVTMDVAGLAIKTGNAVILRGGSETLRTNRALMALVRQELHTCGLPEDAVQLIDDPDRGLVLELLQQVETVDLIIPRGGAALHQFCREHSRIPVITGGIGICHLFVDASADLEAAVPVIFNAKVQRPTVCNALDTVLVHRDLAEQALPRIVHALQQAGVSFRADPRALQALQAAGDVSPAVQPAGPEDFDTEWLSLVLGLKVVDDLEDAIAHIAAHSTGHSDGILTANTENASHFVRVVDSAAVYVNASTRFTDGAQLGLGAEAAISTQRIHARGPLGLRELTSYKWVIQGDYHVRG
jgi:glutamate-5-semialdehyde dehydrogenase